MASAAQLNDEGSRQGHTENCRYFSVLTGHANTKSDVRDRAPAQGPTPIQNIEREMATLEGEMRQLGLVWFGYSLQDRSRGLIFMRSTITTVSEPAAAYAPPRRSGITKPR